MLRQSRLASSRERLPASTEQCLTEQNAIGIHIHQLDRGASLRSQSGDSCLHSCEVLEPGVATGMIQRHHVARSRVDGRDVRALLLIAADAAQAEVVDVIGAEVLAANDVINLVRQHGRVLGQRAILARTSGALPHELASLVRQTHEAKRTARSSSACSLSKLRVSLSRTSSEYSA